MLELRKRIQNPFEYRETRFTLPDGRSVRVAGLARPDASGQKPKDVFQYLKDHDVQVIFGLDVSPDFPAIASSLGLTYINAEIEDFTAPPLDLYDNVYDEVIIQADFGKIIAIHCFGGHGRTGSVLAALKLREMSMSEFFYDMAKQTNRVYCYPSRNCTLNVSAAIENLRREPGNESIVESEIQVESLCQYEQILLERHQHDKTHETDNGCSL